MILAGYPRNGILLKHDDKRRLDAEFPHGRSRKGQRVELGKHDRLCSGDFNSSCLRDNGDSVISRCAQFAFAFDIELLGPLSPLVGFSFFASWHGYETLTVSLVTHKSDGNIELDINMGTMQLRHHKEYSACVSAGHPAISLRHLAPLPTGREASRRIGIRSRFQDTLENHGGDRLNCLAMKDT